MTLLEALDLPAGRGCTALVGGGGKTSLMYRLGAEVAGAGGRAVLTTTTAIRPPEGLPLLTGAAGLERALEPGSAVCLGRPGADGKLHHPGQAALAAALALADRVVAEADGAKGLPAKAPSAFEPVIPLGTDSVVAVAGLDAVGRRLDTVCFRSGLACHLLGVPPDAALTPALLARLLTSPAGQRKGVPPGAAFRVLLNKADGPERLRAGKETAARVRALLPGCRVVVAALRQGEDPVREIFG